ncbi:MAG: lipoprotein [Idiomarina sp.]|nr:lipoprotein [Idiomarina sp.]
MTKRIIKLASGMIALLLISACGQKGPLYMPPERETTDAEEQRRESPTELPQLTHLNDR